MWPNGAFDRLSGIGKAQLTHHVEVVVTLTCATSNDCSKCCQSCATTRPVNNAKLNSRKVHVEYSTTRSRIVE